ncbi:nucleoside-diphosphate sugar epimerase [Bdellovibrio sp. qaytius]|nr:nucleoside-diphosphate sugar epimerase [Bdellovibrio sp. qaytius]
MKKDLILVVGASGTVGSEIVRQLKAQGYSVRATTSKPVKENTEELVHVNMATGEGIKAAFENVDKAFLLSPPGFADQYAMVSPLIQEAKRRGLKKVVLMTAKGVNANPSSPFRRAELELESSGLNYNIIRPNWFLQNFNTFWIQGIKEQKKILLPAGNAKVSFIDARDISTVATKLLVSEEFNNQAFDLTGPQAVDHDYVAAEISKVSGQEIKYKETTSDEFGAGLLAAGLPKDYADFMVTIMGFLREGYSAAVTDSVKKITGRDPIAVSQYAQDYKKSWM